MPDLPRGTVTFLFTDIEGSTALWERDRAAMRAAVAGTWPSCTASSPPITGSSTRPSGMAPRPPSLGRRALRPPSPAQRALLAEAWADPPGPLRVRMALHAGEADPGCARRLPRRPPQSPGAAARRRATAARFSSADACQHSPVLRCRRGVTLRALGEYRLRDILQPERIFQLRHPALPATFPPLNTPGPSAAQPPHAPHPVPGAGAGGGGDHRPLAASGRAAGDADRSGRGGQDAAGTAGRGGGARVVP